ncbi:MAG TPA: bifunctional [glutamate--ammonia ligase]-adenylyl-L-tyrosine phosphorylase/[glutamate--ammonia-ligase] adenylyltransferase, partial [Steroidobacteraceae bacterium]
LAHRLEALAQTPGLTAALERAPEPVRASLEHVIACSDFVAESCAGERSVLPQLLQAGSLLAPQLPAALEQELAGFAAQAEGEERFMERLRHVRRRELVRIAWRDLAGWASLEQTLIELSDLADAALRVASAFALRLLVARYGMPRSQQGVAQPLVIIAMGKLGGRELNFSSDVDLVFLFPEHGETDGAHTIANEEFFTRLGQALIRLLEARTADGIVYRVDMRLRPFGDSGALATSFASFEDYLQRQGRDWERYAYVKARAITAPEAYAEIQANAVRPFVFRRYLDFGVFESLREMKALIERDVERRELDDHVKLGPGGIREIEFIVQAFQLIRGGQDRRLQTASLLAALPLLNDAKSLPPAAVLELGSAYEFLRRLENRLQMLRDEQTHRLPQALIDRERIALAMGLPDWESLLRELASHRAQVSKHFESFVVAAGERPADAASWLDLEPLWDPAGGAAALLGPLRNAGFGDAAEAARLLLELRDSSAMHRLDEAGRRRLRALLGPLVGEIARQAAGGRDPLLVLRRILRIIEAIGARSTYFSLLTESVAARRRLVEICAHGDFLAAQIAAHPLLLDELMDERLLRQLPARVELADDLQLRLEQVSDADPERQVELLRQFQRAAVFRVAVADLTGRLPIMRVSDRLTDVAELIIEQVMALAWRQITAQLGVPIVAQPGGATRAAQVCAVGYGKLGGMELGYASDLDLVFLHDADSVEYGVFFVRLAQRIVHLLTMHSAAGRLYEVDVRLRPSGKGGMLITNVDAFAEYQRTQAWTWEHQALLHARAVAGAPALRARFEAVRLDTLQHHVHRERLRAEVREMRLRMRRELSRAAAGGFDLKQDPGGIADIEFLAQYWALLFAKDHPPVVLFADTIRQLESVASADLVAQASVDVLTHAYRLYRERAHRRSLESASAVVADAEFVSERAAVERIWSATMDDP